jgi:hypothetical protein
MAETIPLKSKAKLGVCPTHIKFVGGLLPDEDGRLPRTPEGVLVVVDNFATLQKMSAAPIDIAQVPFFPGLNPGDVKEMTDGIRALGIEVCFIMMIGGEDPMNPADEDAVVATLLLGIQAAKDNNVEHVSSTSIERWMIDDEVRKEGADFDAAVAQNITLHTRAYRDGGIEGSCIKNWHIEFLRGEEFQTFTDVGRAWEIIKGANKVLGKPFFKILVDAAHCGDSALDIPENQRLIKEIAANDELGIFHASAKTTRGCLTTDDGWIGALLSAAAETGKLEQVYVEVFHHADEALGALRDKVAGHGVDTTDGRTYDQVIVDGLENTARRLNNLVARGVLEAR